jgi:hypothetical protein
MASDFFAMTKRNLFDVRGHSRKEPVFVVKQSQNTDGLPLQVALNQRSGLRVWSPRDREYITDGRAARLELRFQVQLNAAMRFVAKVALSAGYFVYGDLFRNQVKHSDFRAIMSSELASREGLEDVEARVDDRFNENVTEDGLIFRALCKAAEPHSAVGFVHGTGRFGVFVGLLGDYIGLIHVSANLDGFPKDGDHLMGHWIELQRPKLLRKSMKETMQEYVEKVHTQA